MMPGKREALAKVLIIDDEEAVRALARRMLESGNHTIIEAADGVAGLKAFDEEKPDVIVTDIIMPNADGLEVIREILRRDPEARIIAISGGGRLPDQTYLGYARKFGAIAVLPKPFTPEQLLSLIDDLPPPSAPEKAAP